MGCPMNLSIVAAFSFLLVFCYAHDNKQSTKDFYTDSAFNVSATKLEPYDWRYIRINLPPWFSSVSITLESSLHLDEKGIGKYPKSRVPTICFRDGGPPVPDISNVALKELVLNSFYNESAGGLQYINNVKLCYPVPENTTFTLTYEQIMPGAFYVGLFNGIGPIRTQSKMINRGLSYFFKANVTVEACKQEWGQYCNQTVHKLECSIFDRGKVQSYQDATVYNQMVKSVVTCEDSTGVSCHGNMESKFFSLDVSETTEKLIIIAKGVTFDQELPINITFDSSGVNLNLYAQYGAIPKKTLHDYSSDISKVPLVIPSPKVGTWYFTIQPVYPSHVSREMEEKDIKVCYLMKGQVYDCLDGKGGPNCTWEKYVLKAFPRANPTVPYIFLPERYKNLSLGSPNFHLEPFLSKSSNGNKSGFAWTFFSLDIPQGEAGKNIHIQLIAERKIDYELYARFGGSPSLDNWDYCYINKTGISKNSSMLKVYTSGEKITDFYIFYAREGPWGFGLRYPIHMTSDSHPHTTMSISIKSCPNHCSGHGTCQSEQDASGSTYYSYCQCDRTHGGFDCSVELVSREGQRWHSISLIASNAAAILPAFWALRQKAFADWVIFMFSGVSSGLYHACDVGSWCALKFHVLQFMDFWLSFMAVASTFVYLAFISEAAKRAIHTTVSILTAILAVTGATRSSNIFLVVAIGALGLLVGWLIEFFSTFKSSSFSLGSSLNNLKRWKNIKAWLIKLIKTLYKRFRWCFVLMGFIALSMAAISWTMENSQSYWIWHSVWHVSIYTSSFFFLCSKVMTLNGESRAVLNTGYELTLT